MRIVVTGALGHIGSALIRHERFVEAADEITVVDDLSTQRYASLFNLPTGTRYSLIHADVATGLTASVSASADAVIHLAAITEPLASFSDPDWLYNNNLRITKHVSDICSATGTPLVFVSTTSVYTSHQPVVDETSGDLDPSSPYAKCKLEEEAYVLKSADTQQRAVFRLGTIFGVSPGMRFHTAVNKFCWQAAMGQPIDVWSTAMDQQRPYLALSDAVDLLSRTVIESVYPGEVVNAVTCDSTVRDVLSAIEAAGWTTAVNLIDSAIMNALSYRTSVAKAHGLGYKFSGSLEVDVAETLQLLGGFSRRRYGRRGEDPR
jgi:nucleoside-diphosphate-sugar epimerase